MNVHNTTVSTTLSIVLATAAVLAAAPADAQSINQLFAPSSQCLACHNALVTPSGMDISIGSDWRASMMAHSSRDPYWQASVRRETIVRPAASSAIQHECAACHMPMTRFHATINERHGEVFAHLPLTPQKTPRAAFAADGVSCTMCHQIQADRLGEEASFTAGFVVDTSTPTGQRLAFGPFEVTDGRKQLMQSASSFVPEKATHVQQSELCATCHTLYTHALDAEGNVIGELPEQVPYLEWKHSAYSYEGGQSCQSCHMPVVEETTAVTGVLGEAREEVSRHVFRGGNFFMPKILNTFRDQLGVVALPRELETTSLRTAEHLRTSSATVAVENVQHEGVQLSAEVVIDNLAGHKLPTAYPSRRAWLHLTVRDANGSTVFESGSVRPDGSIEGNDNDANADLYEPHYEEITASDQVQIYEGILAGPDDQVTTVLLTATRYIKDNRILPDGFDPATAADDIAVQGHAAGDADFAGGGDRVRYVVDTEGATPPFSVHAELMYQPIAFRWAHNLSQQEAAEIDRFVAAYRALSSSSAIVLASAAASSR